MITVISILGVAAGVMALVIALAVNNGFRSTLQRNLLGAMAHINVHPEGARRRHRGLAGAGGAAPQGAARHRGLAGALRRGVISAGRCGRRARC